MLSATLRSSTRGLIAVPRGVAFAQRRTVISLSKTATASGAGRNGKTELDDGSLGVMLATPKEMGGSGNGQNPEQLFALGYSSCFLGALQLVAKNKNVKLSDDVKIKAAVSLGEASGGFGIGVEITAIGADAALVQEAHTVCPYSRILAEGAEVKLTIK
ncbi:hypothetical protein FS749_015019 [Ceratobasidium sp. UAMH 11750]|nr:hypothetical protein FS749_015019 [Ceratobasidium sp. UAMH 11750]